MTVYKRATLICPKCKTKMVDVVKEEGEPFPNKCDKCGSTNVMVTYLVTNIKDLEAVEPTKARLGRPPKIAEARV